MWFALHYIGTGENCSASVEGITQRMLHSQSGILVITRPGKRTRTIRLTNRGMVNRAIRFAARYNRACASKNTGLGMTDPRTT